MGRVLCGCGEFFLHAAGLNSATSTPHVVIFRVKSDWNHLEAPPPGITPGILPDSSGTRHRCLQPLLFERCSISNSAARSAISCFYRALHPHLLALEAQTGAELVLDVLREATLMLFPRLSQEYFEVFGDKSVGGGLFRATLLVGGIGCSEGSLSHASPESASCRSKTQCFSLGTRVACAWRAHGRRR
jgi:hypothetical protein